MNLLEKILGPNFILPWFKTKANQRSKRSGKHIRGAFGGKGANGPRLRAWEQSVKDGNTLAQERRLKRLGCPACK